MSDQDRQRDGAQGRSTVRRPRTVSFGAAEAPTTRKADDRRADVWRGEGVHGPRARQRPDTGSPVPDTAFSGEHPWRPVPGRTVSRPDGRRSTRQSESS